MKRTNLALALIMLIVVTSGCQHGRWRLRGAKCRPGMSMPTYAQPAVPPPGAQAPCNQGCPAPNYPGFPGAGYPGPGYGGPMPGGPPTGFMQSSGYAPNGFYENGDYISGQGAVTSDVVVGEYPSTSVEGVPQTMQRPIIDSSMVESTDGSIMTVPGPETGPLPNG